MNNVTRFLFESAIYLDLDPAQAFRKLCAGADERTHDDASAGDAWLHDALCHKQAITYSQPCNQ
ncbi:hypothetical protein J2T55_001311 [Methylohalomonas lacus]|uniref:Uncharacterized protein n=1 Tax=Methylohalomonas lacus TaxID=398773 RepID=A0AAE3HJ20_9GAMM|nr:hypothetical protein [Methylohalomonas lacus]MCS3903291.1 hypothetical protein [Methylohalomonas lacus]